MFYMFQAVSASISDKLIGLHVSTNILLHIAGRLLKKLCRKNKHDQSNLITHNQSQNKHGSLTFIYFLNTARMSSLKLGCRTVRRRSMEMTGSV